MALNPAQLRSHYTHFLGEGDEAHHEGPHGRRLLLTGHSHQAWPDVAREAVIEAFEHAALHVDDKWGVVFERAEYLRGVIAREVSCEAGEVALAQNTHELFSRFLSALDLRKRPKIICTDGEFHSVYRQLSALEAAGVVEVCWVSSHTPETLTERMIEALDERCAAVVCSTVMFQDGRLTTHLPELSEACARVGARLFLDAYHSFKVVPLSLEGLCAEVTYVSGGGYKYAQWGEGACWLRVPQNDTLRPLFTGWFSDFERLHEPRVQGAPTTYGDRGAERFAGSTFDPTSWYRAARVARFFEEQGMSTEALRALSMHQTSRLAEGLKAHFELLSPELAHERGGFVAVRAPHAERWVKGLRARGVWVDARGDALRFGPAPYLRDSDLDETLERVGAQALALKG